MRWVPAEKGERRPLKEEDRQVRPESNWRKPRMNSSYDIRGLKSSLPLKVKEGKFKEDFREEEERRFCLRAKKPKMAKLF